MNLSHLLGARAEAGRPVTVVVIGAGKFGAMFLAQARRTHGLHVVAVVDLAAARARNVLARTFWPEEQYAAASLDAALGSGSTLVTEDAMAAIACPGVEVVVDATGSPAAAIDHALACLNHGKHFVNVTVEADVLVGPLLARRFRSAGLVYSLAYGDQPALIAEQVDWARACGFDVVAAGKGTKYLPAYHYSTPETVWGFYGMTPERAAEGGLNPQMFNSFLDGTKSAIEMAAVANACDLEPQPAGLSFPPCGVDDLAHMLRPRGDGGILERKGTVEVVSSLERDGRPVFRDLRWGVYVVFEAPTEYVERCFAEYGLRTDDSGRYAALYKPYHLIGLELGISVASAALRGEPTGAPLAFHGDVVAVAKRDLGPGETLDGEGGETVFGRLMPSAESLRAGALPIGLAHRLRLKNPVARDTVLTWADVAVDDARPDICLRRDLEAMGGPR
ncbi:MAG TPA: SAF domain-containing protein [Alphaproteobacteria bacterium]|nr:SAF domain-containing protein [Alphaproteobacteria bacterium]